MLTNIKLTSPILEANENKKRTRKKAAEKCVWTFRHKKKLRKKPKESWTGKREECKRKKDLAEGLRWIDVKGAACVASWCRHRLKSFCCDYWWVFVKMGQSRPFFVYFPYFLDTITVIQIEKSMVCLGFEPGAAVW